MSSKKASEVVFRRSKGGDDCEIEAWDDAVLMKAYDVSVSASNEILMSQDEEEENHLSEEEEFEADPAEGEIVWQRKPGVEVRSIAETSKAKKSKMEKEFSADTDNQWNIGDECMAIYYSDNLYYRASIVSIHHDTGHAVVNFDDYNEEGEISLEDIYPLNMFINEENEEFVEQKPSKVELKNASSIHKSKKSRPKKQKQSHNDIKSSEPFEINPSLLFPPPPPMTNMPHVPNMFSGNGLPPNLSRMLPSDMNKEALSSMLVSWYMAGYHTGYYRGLNSQQTAKSTKSKNLPK